MAETLERMPDTITAGEDITFKADHSADGISPNDGFTARLAMTKSDGTSAATPLAGSADPSGDFWTFTLDDTATAALAAGTWFYQIRADKAGANTVVERGRFELEPDFAAAVDARSHAQTILDAIDATLENRATHDQLAYTIGGRSLQRLTPRELREWRAEYQNRVRQEIAKERRARGQSTSNKILTRW